MQRRWKITKHKRMGRWSNGYVSVNTKGMIVLSRVLLDLVGRPAAFILMYDADSETIGLRPAVESEEHAFHIQPTGRHGGGTIRGGKLLKENNLKLHTCLQFPYPEVDDGILILDLRTAEPVRHGRPAANPRPLRSDQPYTIRS